MEPQNTRRSSPRAGLFPGTRVAPCRRGRPSPRTRGCSADVLEVREEPAGRPRVGGAIPDAIEITTKVMSVVSAPAELFPG